MRGMRGDVWPKVPKALSQDLRADEALNYIHHLPCVLKIFSEEKEQLYSKEQRQRIELGKSRRSDSCPVFL